MAGWRWEEWMMNRLLVVLVLVVAGIVGLGFYQGWFHVASDGGGGESNITFTVDTDKMHEDKDKAMEKVQDLGHQAKDKAAPPTEKSKDQATPPVPEPQK
jgi:hypothetical protein